MKDLGHPGDSPGPKASGTAKAGHWRQVQRENVNQKGSANVKSRTNRATETRKEVTRPQRSKHRVGSETGPATRPESECHPPTMALACTWHFF